MLPVCISGEGEPLLMIHGIVSDGSFFTNLSNELRDCFTTVSYDRRGYGESEGPFDDYSIKAQAEDAADILKNCVGQSAWVFGNSAGGLIALELTRKYPELVKGLILLEPSLLVDDECRETIQAWNAELNGYLREGRIKKALPALARAIGDKAEEPTGMSMAEMKKNYRNLDNFMHGELNEVQRFYPPLDEIGKISVPIYMIITEQGSGGIYARVAKRSAEYYGWPLRTVQGYHNAARRNAESTAEVISQIIGEIRNEK